MQATVLILDIPDDSGQVFLVCVCVCGYDKDCGGDHYKRAYRGSKKLFFRSVCRLGERGKRKKTRNDGQEKDFDSSESVGLIRRVNVGINNHKVIIK